MTKDFDNRTTTDGRPHYYGQRLLYYALAIISADIFLSWGMFSALVPDIIAGNETGEWTAPLAANCLFIAFVSAFLLPRGLRINREYGRRHVFFHLIFLLAFSLILGIWTLVLALR